MQSDQSQLIHVANLLYLASYSVRDILWLRILSVLGMLCLGWCYFYCAQEDPQWWNALYWQIAFLGINLVQIGVLIYERLPVKLSEVQQQLHRGPLKSLTPRQVQRFSDRAEWYTVAPGEQIPSENSPLDFLVLLLSGQASVIADGREIARLTEGQFAGEMSFLSGGMTTADVIAQGTVLCARWPERYVKELMQQDRDLGTALQSALGADLVRKLLNSRNPTDEKLRNL